MMIHLIIETKKETCRSFQVQTLKSHKENNFIDILNDFALNNHQNEDVYDEVLSIVNQQNHRMFYLILNY
jgi:hypothetical protein